MRHFVIEELERLGAATALSALGLRTDDQVWQRLAGNRNGELNLLGMQLGLPPRAILKVLGQLSLHEAKRYRPAWWKRFALDYAVLAAFSGFVVLAWLAWMRMPVTSRVQVVAVRDIEPFQPIHDRDVKAEWKGRVPGAEEKIDQVLDRYSVEPITAQSVITSNALSASKVPGPMVGRVVLRVPIDKTELVPASNLPRLVTMIISPKESGTAGIVISDVYLLSMPPGDSLAAVVAMPGSSLQAFAGAIGGGLVHFAIPGRD